MTLEQISSRAARRRIAIVGIFCTLYASAAGVLMRLGSWRWLLALPFTVYAVRVARRTISAGGGLGMVWRGDL